MILPREITEVAERLQVTKSTIDKDWALGHFVNGLYREEDLGNKLIFKGGTCLRKCYFEEYRFSEDLDFTVLEPQFDFSPELLSRVCQRVESISGIRTHIQELRPLSFNLRKTGFQADVKFWGLIIPVIRHLYPRSVGKPALRLRLFCSKRCCSILWSAHFFTRILIIRC